MCDKLKNEALLKSARVHPFSLLLALNIYTAGKGDKGSLSWSPVPAICSALDAAFYLSFKFVEATGKRFLLALDVSGSMGSPVSYCFTVVLMDYGYWLNTGDSLHNRNTDKAILFIPLAYTNACK